MQFPSREAFEDFYYRPRVSGSPRDARRGQLWTAGRCGEPTLVGRCRSRDARARSRDGLTFPPVWPLTRSGRRREPGLPLTPRLPLAVYGRELAVQQGLPPDRPIPGGLALKRVTRSSARNPAARSVCGRVSTTAIGCVGCGTQLPYGPMTTSKSTVKASLPAMPAHSI